MSRPHYDGDGERGGCHGHVQKMMEMDRNGHDHTVMFRKMMEMEMERKRGRDLRSHSRVRS